MSSKAWYALAIIFFILLLFLGGWLWLVLAIVCVIMGYRAGKKEKMMQYPAPPYPPPQPAAPYGFSYPQPAPPPRPVQPTAVSQVQAPYSFICPNCGQQLSGHEAFCPRCGYNLATR